MILQKGSKMVSFKDETNFVHGIDVKYLTRDLVPPLHMTSTYIFDDADHGARLFAGDFEENDFLYTRDNNPTIDQLQKKMARLEGGKGAIATASGMAAIFIAAISLLKPGDNFVSCSTLYGGTYAFFTQKLSKLDMTARLIQSKHCHDIEKIKEQIDERTKFLYIETPSNPTLDIIDIKFWADIAKEFNIPLIVDNTFASPYLQKPLTLGADIVVHSATKYLGGHGDLVGGIVVAKGLIEIIRSYAFHYGPIMSPFNAWLILRGLKTLPVRMDRQCENAFKIVLFLNNHEKVERVYHPSFSDHQIVENQMRDHGAMIAFVLKGGMEAGKKFIDSVKLWIRTISLGDCESLVQHPASMTHSTYSADELKLAGIPEGLIRASVGIEDHVDLIDDLEKALEKV